MQKKLGASFHEIVGLARPSWRTAAHRKWRLSNSPPRGVDPCPVARFGLCHRQCSNRLRAIHSKFLWRASHSEAGDVVPVQRLCRQPFSDSFIHLRRHSSMIQCPASTVASLRRSRSSCIGSARRLCVVSHIRNAEIDDASAPLGMVRCHRPGDGASPIVPDPNGWRAAQSVMQLHHVGDKLADAVGRERIRPRRPAIAAHIRCYAVPTSGREMLDLPPPRQPKLRPTVEKDH